jgi:hypothetical protein
MFKAVDGRIEARERDLEEWKTSHQKAIICRNFERWLYQTIEIFEVIQEIDRVWRLEVFRGAAQFNEEHYRNLRQLYERWIGLFAVARPLLDQFHKEGYDGGIDGAAAFAHCREQAEAILARMEPPTLSKAIGLREQVLDPQASKEVRAIIERARSQPAPVVEPIKTIAAASFFSSKTAR